MDLNRENNKSKKEGNPFSMPDGYFDSFAKKMMHRIELADEIKEFKILSSLDKTVPFNTPVGYFDTKSELMQYPTVFALRNKAVYSVPENYFEVSAKAIRNNIELAEELTAYPLLSGITKHYSFVTPNGYFDDLSLRLRGNKDQDNTSGKIIRLIFSKKAAYALAAMLVISLGLYFYNSKTEAADTGCNTLACLDRREIVKENQLNSMDEDALLEMVNTEELSKNLHKKIKEEVNAGSGQQNAEEYILENTDVNDITDEI